MKRPKVPVGRTDTYLGPPIVQGPLIVNDGIIITKGKTSHEPSWKVTFVTEKRSIYYFTKCHATYATERDFGRQSIASEHIKAQHCPTRQISKCIGYPVSGDTTTKSKTKAQQMCPTSNRKKNTVTCWTRHNLTSLLRIVTNKTYPLCRQPACAT